MQYSLIWNLMLFEFELGLNAVKAIKSICHMKDEGAVDYYNLVVQEILLELPEL